MAGLTVSGAGNFLDWQGWAALPSEAKEDQRFVEDAWSGVAAPVEFRLVVTRETRGGETKYLSGLTQRDVACFVFAEKGSARVVYLDERNKPEQSSKIPRRTHTEKSIDPSPRDPGETEAPYYYVVVSARQSDLSARSWFFALHVRSNGDLGILVTWVRSD
jgi:hypothetical protein